MQKAAMRDKETVRLINQYYGSDSKAKEYFLNINYADSPSQTSLKIRRDIKYVANMIGAIQLQYRLISTDIRTHMLIASHNVLWTALHASIMAFATFDTGYNATGSGAINTIANIDAIGVIGLAGGLNTDVPTCTLLSRLRVANNATSIDLLRLLTTAEKNLIINATIANCAPVDAVGAVVAQNALWIEFNRARIAYFEAFSNIGLNIFTTAEINTIIDANNIVAEFGPADTPPHFIISLIQGFIRLCSSYVRREGPYPINDIRLTTVVGAGNVITVAEGLTQLQHNNLITLAKQNHDNAIIAYLTQLQVTNQRLATKIAKRIAKHLKSINYNIDETNAVAYLENPAVGHGDTQILERNNTLQVFEKMGNNEDPLAQGQYNAIPPFIQLYKTAVFSKCEIDPTYRTIMDSFIKIGNRCLEYISSPIINYNHLEVARYAQYYLSLQPTYNTNIKIVTNYFINNLNELINVMNFFPKFSFERNNYIIQVPKAYNLVDLFYMINAYNKKFITTIALYVPPITKNLTLNKQINNKTKEIAGYYGDVKYSVQNKIDTGNAIGRVHATLNVLSNKLNTSNFKNLKVKALTDYLDDIEADQRYTDQDKILIGAQILAQIAAISEKKQYIEQQANNKQLGELFKQRKFMGVI